MAVSLKYSVHGVSVGKKAVAAKLANGKEVQAEVDTLRVELVNADGHGTLALNFGPDEFDTAKAVFGPDAVINVTFSAVGGE